MGLMEMKKTTGNLCPDYIIGPGTGVSAWMFGSEVAGDFGLRGTS